MILSWKYRTSYFDQCSRKKIPVKLLFIPTLGILYSEREVIKIQEWLGRYQNFFEIVLGKSKEKPFSGLSTEERPEPGFYKHNGHCWISFLSIQYM